MKLTITVRTDLNARAFVERALAGLVGTTDEGCEVVAAIEELLDADNGPGPGLTSSDVAVLYRSLNGSVSATARELGIARSTVRAHLAKAPPVEAVAVTQLAANDG